MGLWNSEFEIWFQESRLDGWVPKEPLTLARHFNAGLYAEKAQVPEGRLTFG